MLRLEREGKIGRDGDGVSPISGFYLHRDAIDLDGECDGMVLRSVLADALFIRVPEVSCGQHKRRQDAHQSTRIAQDDLFILQAVVSSVVI